MHHACIGRSPSTLALLLDAGASLDSCTATGFTLPMFAMDGDASECLIVLLARPGLDINVVTDRGTALHFAVINNEAHSMRLLLQAGADPTIRNEQGITPLQFAVVQNHQQCTALLEAALAEPHLNPARPRALLKARALVDARRVLPLMKRCLTRKGLPVEVQLLVCA